MFKLARLWNLSLCDKAFTPREIPSERRDFNTHLPDNKKLVALFDPSAKYQLVETYGPDCYTETKDGRLRLEAGYTNRDYMISWLLSFGAKAMVVEPNDLAEELKRIAKEIFESYL